MNGPVSEPQSEADNDDAEAGARKRRLTVGAVAGGCCVLVVLVVLAVSCLARNDNGTVGNGDATAAQPDALPDHSDGGHGGTREVPSGLPAPTLAVSAFEDPTGGWAVQAQTSGFRFAPERVNGAHRDGEGHLHWFLDGVKQGRVFGEWWHIRGLASGSHTLMVELSANDHAVYTKGGVPIRAEVELTEAPAGAKLEHDHDHTAVAPDPSPSVTVEVMSDGGGGWLVHAVPERWTLNPRAAGGPHVPGEGHMLLSVDGVKHARMYSEWAALPDLSAGLHTVRVALRTNDLRVLQSDGDLIAAEASLFVEQDDTPNGHDHTSEAGGASEASLDDRRGQVHIHEDGSSHTHGAGAPKEWIVTYTADNEFVPERVDILAGDTVTWVNESDVGVWPASNIHPSHEILPEFDPLADIPPGESWSFRFDENGYWRYHNHSYASEVGLVVVTGGPEQDILEVMGDFHSMEFSDPPANPDHRLLLTDWDALEDFVLEYGPEATVAILFAYEVETGWQCHAAAHEIGRIAYEAFGASVFSIESHQCSTGVLHGVVEAMLAERGTANLGEDITAVCMATDSHFTQASCWHGVGHGVMAWTSYEIHDALELCDLVEGVGGAWGCYSGVFMENVVGGMADLTGHESEYIDPNDPHLPCSVVAERYIEPCYSYQGIHMVHVFGGDYRAVIGECTSIDEEYQVHCLRAMGSNIGGVYKRQPASAAQACGLIPSSVPYLHCIAAAINEMFRHPDEAAYVIDFCEVLDEQDRAGANECWWSLIDRTEALVHNREEREAFCATLPPGHRQQYCQEQLLPQTAGN